MLNTLRKRKDRWIARLLVAFPALYHKWVDSGEFVKSQDIPWSSLDKPASACKLAFITTGGFYVSGQEPFNMDDPEGDPSFREIPSVIDPSLLQISHNYYDHRDAEVDPNIILPVGIAQKLVEMGDVKEINHRFFSFMGHLTGDQLETLQIETAPEVAKLLVADGVEIAILTPA